MIAREKTASKSKAEEKSFSFFLFFFDDDVSDFDDFSFKDDAIFQNKVRE